MTYKSGFIHASVLGIVNGGKDERIYMAEHIDDLQEAELAYNEAKQFEQDWRRVRYAIQMRYFQLKKERHSEQQL